LQNEKDSDLRGSNHITETVTFPSHKNRPNILHFLSIGVPKVAIMFKTRLRSRTDAFKYCRRAFSLAVSGLWAYPKNELYYKIIEINRECKSWIVEFLA